MYEKFFGLQERPFDLTPNRRYLFLTARHREALAALRYGITAHRGIILLIGDAGTGKTTLLRTGLESVESRDFRYVYLSNPTLNRDEFYEYLTAGFGLPADCARSKARFLLELHDSVMARHQAGGHTALVLDEAQSLPIELLEEVRLLANLETATQKLLPVVLAGQPELADRLNQMSLRQFKQRVALRCELAPLDLGGTAAYIAGRLRIAGGDAAQIFTREAVEVIYEASRGIPRTISVICDNALVTGFAAYERPVSATLVREVCSDFDLLLGGPPSVPIPAGPVPVGRPAALAEVQVPAPRPAPPVTERAPGGLPAPSEPQVGGKASGELFSQFTRRPRFSFF